jgi:hypothetical protein
VSGAGSQNFLPITLIWYSAEISVSFPVVLYGDGGHVVVLLRHGLLPPESWQLAVLPTVE